MKKIIILGILTMIFGSCGKDFLSIPSKTQLTTSVYYKTEADFMTALNGIYAPIEGWYNPGPYNSPPPPILVGDMHSDNARYMQNPNFRAEASVAAEEVADFVPEPQLLSGWWTNFYDWIARSNQILSLIDDADLAQGVKDNIKGQALFLRTFAYWWLVRMYGDVVLTLEPVTSLADANKPLTPAADIWTQIIKDAGDAATLLPDKANQDPGYVTSGAANMLLADALMWNKQWSDAETALKKVTGYSLMSSYAAVFNPANKGSNPEDIFSIQYTNSVPSLASRFGYFMLPLPILADTLQALTGISNPQGVSAGEPFNLPTPELMAKYATGDERYAASIKISHNSSGTPLPICIKYLHPHSLYQQADENWPVFRYAETLLDLAEVINEQGGRSGDALGYLNQVRNRAGLADFTSTDQAAIRQEILDQRQVEFYGEGKRWWDLVRTDNIATYITPYGNNAYNPANHVEYYNPSYFNQAFTDLSPTFEIPNVERLANPNIPDTQ